MNDVFITPLGGGQYEITLQSDGRLLKRVIETNDAHTLRVVQTMCSLFKQLLQGAAFASSLATPAEIGRRAGR